jgi:hypothetical protein
MTHQLDVLVTIAQKPTGELAFSYAPQIPSQNTAKYLDPATGNIAVPGGTGALQINFHLDPEPSLRVNFNLGTSTSQPMTIWHLDGGKKVPYPGDFGTPQLATSDPPMMVVGVLDLHKYSTTEDYAYQITVAHDTGGTTKLVSTPDPKIRNGGQSSNTAWLLPVAIITVVAVAAVFAWRARRRLPPA